MRGLAPVRFELLLGELLDGGEEGVRVLLGGPGSDRGRRGHGSGGVAVVVEVLVQEGVGQDEVGEGVGPGGVVGVGAGELFGEAGGGPPVLEGGGHPSDAGRDGVVREQRPDGRRRLGVPYVRAREGLGEQDVREGGPPHEVRPAHAVGQGRAVEGGEPAPYVLGVGEVGAAGVQEGGVPAVPGEVAGIVHGPFEVGPGVRDHSGDPLGAVPVEAGGERPEHGGVERELAGRHVHERRQVLHEELPRQLGRRLGQPRPPVGPSEREEPEHRLGGPRERGVVVLGRSADEFEEPVEPGVGENGLGHASQGSSGRAVQGCKERAAGVSPQFGAGVQRTVTVLGAEKSPQVPSGRRARRVRV